jgi:anti-sigma B factor antagonist
MSTLAQARRSRDGAAAVIDSRANAVLAFRVRGTPNSQGERRMKIVERQVEDVTVLDLHGKILIGEGDDALRDAVTRLVDGGRTKLLLNLADVPYVDSAGLGEIVRCYTTVSRKGGRLKLVNLTKKIQDLLAITKLLTVFETYDSEDEAVRSF